MTVNKATVFVKQNTNSIEIGGKCMLPPEDHKVDTVFLYEPPPVQDIPHSLSRLYLMDKQRISSKVSRIEITPLLDHSHYFPSYHFVNNYDDIVGKKSPVIATHIDLY